MKTAIWTVAVVGLVCVVATIAPDIRRYLRMVCM